ncbi:MAG: hypothetical protein MMC23_002001 [Stictis urceolatum]|nr:hypothetical protein [Stictis urceolata]
MSSSSDHDQAKADSKLAATNIDEAKAGLNLAAAIIDKAGSDLESATSDITKAVADLESAAIKVNKAVTDLKSAATSVVEAIAGVKSMDSGAKEASLRTAMPILMNELTQDQLERRALRNVINAELDLDTLPTRVFYVQTEEMAIHHGRYSHVQLQELCVMATLFQRGKDLVTKLYDWHSQMAEADANI